MVLSLKAARINAKISQEAVAKALNVSIKTVSNWETGRSFPSGVRFVRLCELYGVSVNDIFLPS